MTPRKRAAQKAPEKSGRRIRYQVACSLDGFIADEKGGADWIVDERTIDFAELFAQFDTLLMGRVTYESMTKQGTSDFWGKKVYVFSRTLRPQEHPGVTVVAGGIRQLLKELRAQPGKDIWLFGGGELFRSLLERSLVDTVEPAIIPVLVGGGVPFLPSPAVLKRLTLTGHRVFPSGIVWLQYKVEPPDS